jgi:hypothetical protein
MRFLLLPLGSCRNSNERRPASTVPSDELKICEVAVCLTMEKRAGGKEEEAGRRQHEKAFRDGDKRG